jgi:hypothetical protein
VLERRRETLSFQSLGQNHRHHRQQDGTRMAIRRRGGAWREESAVENPRLASSSELLIPALSRSESVSRAVSRLRNVENESCREG